MKHTESILLNFVFILIILLVAVNAQVNVVNEIVQVEGRSIQQGSAAPGEITQSTTWNSEDSPYTLNQNLIIRKEAVLTVSYGSEIIFSSCNISIIVEGGLKILGKSRWSGVTVTVKGENCHGRNDGLFQFVSAKHPSVVQDLNYVSGSILKFVTVEASVPVVLAKDTTLLIKDCFFTFAKTNLFEQSTQTIVVSTAHVYVVSSEFVVNSGKRPESHSVIKLLDSADVTVTKSIFYKSGVAVYVTSSNNIVFVDNTVGDTVGFQCPETGCKTGKKLYEDNIWDYTTSPFLYYDYSSTEPLIIRKNTFTNCGYGGWASISGNGYLELVENIFLSGAPIISWGYNYTSWTSSWYQGSAVISKNVFTRSAFPPFAHVHGAKIIVSDNSAKEAVFNIPMSFSAKELVLDNNSFTNSRIDTSYLSSIIDIQGTADGPKQKVDFTRNTFSGIDLESAQDFTVLTIKSAVRKFEKNTFDNNVNTTAGQYEISYDPGADAPSLKIVNCNIGGKSKSRILSNVKLAANAKVSVSVDSGRRPAAIIVPILLVAFAIVVFVGVAFVVAWFVWSKGHFGDRKSPLIGN